LIINKVYNVLYGLLFDIEQYAYAGRRCIGEQYFIRLSPSGAPAGAPNCTLLEPLNG